MINLDLINLLPPPQQVTGAHGVENDLAKDGCRQGVLPCVFFSIGVGCVERAQTWLLLVRRYAGIS